MGREIDKSKKSNIKCEHCKYFDNVGKVLTYCAHPKPSVTKNINYYNRCKLFEWAK
jgi:hypothetical protein